MNKNSVRLIAVVSVALLVVALLVVLQMGQPALSSALSVGFVTQQPNRADTNAPIAITQADTGAQTALQPTATSVVSAPSNPTPAISRVTAAPPGPPLPSAAEVSSHPDLLAALNTARSAGGIAPLSASSSLDTVAQGVAQANSAGRSPEGDIDQLARANAYYGDRYSLLSLEMGRYNGETVANAWLNNGGIQATILDADLTDAGFGRATTADGSTVVIAVLAERTMLTAPGALISNPGAANQAAQSAAILQLLNEQRAAQGMSRLSTDAQLEQTALAHSNDQAARDVLTHDGADGSTVAERVQRNGYAYSAVGENVLSRPDINAPGAFDQWWNSEGHYANMMNPAYSEIGIRYAQAADGTYYYTMVLAAPR